MIIRNVFTIFVKNRYKIMTDKSEIRREVRRRIAELSQQQRLDAAEEIFRRIEASEQFARAHCIALYASLPDEVPTHEVIARWASTKRVVLPRVEGEIMRFYDYNPSTMSRGSFGIDEPEAAVECLPAEIDMMVIPARAFTPSGVRLGRGKGFYDRYMSQPEFRAYKIGVAFECQIFDTLPFEDHDITANEVIF